MKHQLKLRPLAQKSAYGGSHATSQQKMMANLMETIQGLSHHIKQLGDSISMNHFKSKNQSNIQESSFSNEDSILNRRETRFQPIYIDLPRQNQLSGPNRTDTIRQWLGKICKEIFSIGFQAYHNEIFSDDKLKSFCSENLLRNIVRLSQHHKLTPNDFKVINECLKDDLIPYFTLKYPLTEDIESTIRFAREVVQKNILEEPENDLVHKSGIKFAIHENGNYNSQIMRFLNFIINTPNKMMRDFFPDFQSNETTLANQFVEDMEDCFSIIESKHKVYQLKLYDPNDPSKNIQFDEKKNRYSPEELHEYEQKVKGYTEQKISRKIEESLLPYSESDCLAGNLKIQKSSIMRIVSKWCEQLQKNFNFDQFLSRQAMFRMKKGNTRFLKYSDLKILAFILQYELREITQYLEKVMDNNYKNQSQYSQKEIDKKLRIFSEEEAMVGQFSSIILQCNENYLIGFLNILIHGIMNATKLYTKYLYIEANENIELQNAAERLSMADPKTIDEFIKTLNEITDYTQQCEIDHKVPQLITFKIGDLLRCKCSSKQDQVLTLYKYFQWLSETNPDYLKIVRLKNRLEKGTKDILLNLMYRNTMLIEVQLSIKSNSSKFIQKSNKFGHYLYQLERAQFGPVSELCNIWVNRDLRSKFYTEYFLSNNTRGIHENLKEKKSTCCEIRENQRGLTLPFKCDDCQCFYFDSNYVHPHVQCIACLKKVCVRCYYDRGGFQKLAQIIPEIQYSVLQLKKSKIQLNQLRLCQQIPEYGFLLNLRSKKIIAKFFYTVFYQKSAYLFENIQIRGDPHSKMKAPNFALIEKVNLDSEQEMKKFFSSNLIYTTEELKDKIKKIGLVQAQTQYFVPQQLNKINRNHALSINMMQKNLTEDVFHYIPPEIKFQHVSKINFYGNQFKNLDPVINLFPNIEQAILNQNEIIEVPDSIEKWSRYLKKLQIKRNQIASISDKIGELRNLTHLEVHFNNQLSHFPKSIENLVNLEELWLSGCRFDSIPNEIRTLKKLKILMLSDNSPLQKIPQEISGLESLELLGLDDCPDLKQLPKNLKNLKNLKSLIGHNTAISYLPNGIEDMTSLEQINLSKKDGLPLQCRIKELPDNFGKLKQLKTLKLSYNRLVRLPEKFGQLKNLKELNLYGNQLVELPTSFGNLSSMISCNLSKNQIQNLPNTISRMKSLKVLNIASNQLTALPKALKNLSSLEQLNISKNRIERLQNLGKNIIHINCSTNKIRSIDGFLQHIKRLTNLNLSWNQLEGFPEELGYCLNLVSLCMKGNRIQHLPSFIFKLNKIQCLNLDDNKITSIELIPEKHTKHSMLKKLSLNHNQIKQMQQFCKLPKLQILDLSYNQLHEIPECIKKLLNIKQLNFQSNVIKSIPISLRYAGKLAVLNLSKNGISHIPDDRIEGMMNLEILGLNQNKIKKIDGIHGMIKLKQLRLSDNLLETLPEMPPNIQNLSVDRNIFISVPKTIISLKKLHILTIRQCLFDCLPPEFVELGNTLFQLQIDSEKLNSASQQILRKTRQMIKRHN